MAKGRKTGGRLKGTPNKVTQDVQALSRGLVEDAGYLDALRQRLREGTAGSAVEVMLWSYAFGRAGLESEGGSSFPATITVTF